mmetsp:Transcript_66800/g.171991  ORF Transcript_66800/g.171991 Transcript_66800/m.171991 type:complete len:161 (-) Transcript_66800:134-616(-)
MSLRWWALWASTLLAGEPLLGGGGRGFVHALEEAPTPTPTKLAVKEALEEEEDETEEEKELNRFLNEHKFGSYCVRKAEAAESTIGLFDDHDKDKDHLSKLAVHMGKIGADLYGKRAHEFETKLMQMLEGVRAEEESTFGAKDACKLLIDYHDGLLRAEL